MFENTLEQFHENESLRDEFRFQFIEKAINRLEMLISMVRIVN